MKKIDEFAENHATVFAVTLFIVSMPVLWGLLYIPLHVAGWDRRVTAGLKYTASAVFSLAFMYGIWKRKVFSFEGAHFFKSLFTFGLVGLIGAVAAFAFSYSEVDLQPTASVIAACVYMNFAIAFCEEVLFRGIILNVMLDKRMNRKNVVKAAIAASAIFGLRHLINLFSYPVQIVKTSAQVVFTFMAGIYLAAVYLRSQNIWVCITIHFLEDIGTSIWEVFSSKAAASAITDISLLQALGMVALQIPYILVAFLMLKDKNWKQPKTTDSR